VGAAQIMKRIGFLSFGHYQPVPGSLVRTASDSLHQTIELAVAAEELGIDGAFVRIHHFARQLASPFPLLAAMGARTSTIELGTAVIDMRYENPLYMAEAAAATDLIAGGRLQLGLSRGSPEHVVNGYESFGYLPDSNATSDDPAAAVAWPQRSHLVGLRNARDSEVDRRAGYAPDEFDPAHGGHRRAVRRTAS
jgi:Luciferase-like monooxygenase